MYDKWFRITENIWNNSFSYDVRKIKKSEPKIYVTDLIEWTIDNIQIWNKIVFEEVDSKSEVQSFVWLKNFIKLSSWALAKDINLYSSLHSEWQSAPIYIFDNHNHALFFRYQELLNWNIAKWINLIHLDQHTDMNDNLNVIAREAKQSYSLEYIFHFTNYKCNVGNFIQPAIQSWLISKVIQINTEYSLLNKSINKDSKIILDIDLDFRHPQMWIEKYTQTIEITKNLISQASSVTIATSPYFLDQTLAIKILKDIFSI